MTFIPVWLFIWDISDSSAIGIVSVLLIIPPGFLWEKFMYKKVRDNIARELRSENIVEVGLCPKCGAKAIIGKKVFKLNLGYKIIDCVDGCRLKNEEFVRLNIG